MYNYIVIMTDGARASFANDPKVMPSTHEFMRKYGGKKFLNAYTTTTWTLPAQMSLFTGLLPSNHGLSDITRNNRRKIVNTLDDCYFGAKHVKEEDFLVNRLKAKGYNTKIFSNYITYNFLAKTHHQYFDETVFWDFFYHQSEKIFEQEIDRDNPFFWFMYDDDGGHSPYGVGKRDKRKDFDANKGKLITDSEARARPKVYTKKVLKNMVRGQLHQYDTEKLSRFWDWFVSSGLHKNTVVFFISDHGECYAEHSWTGHVANCYEPIVRIPMFMYHPDMTELTEDRHLRSICDIYPTILEHEYGMWDGISLNVAQPERKVYFEFTRDAEPLERGNDANPIKRFFIRGLRHKQYKYLYQKLTNGKKLIELHNLNKQPRESLEMRMHEPKLEKFYDEQLRQVYEY